MKLSDYNFELPEDLIAKHPVSPRDSSKLLVVESPSLQLSHRRFSELTQILKPGDVLVTNDTKVLPARLFGSLGDSTIELLLLEPVPEKRDAWKVLGKPGRKLKSGVELKFEGGTTAVISKNSDGELSATFQLPEQQTFYSWVHQAGHLPLPPYLKRKTESRDSTDYQTVYAEKAGSIAAPTAGLHFTNRLLGELKEKGIQLTSLTLHVGYGTFAPIRTESVEDHVIHAENYEIPQSTLETLQAARAEGRRILSVGTTTVRALESFGKTGKPLGRTDLFIQPGHRFQWVDGLITNFHLPQSSLLVLVSALVGREQLLATYQTAIEQKYRFFSFGDAMLIL